METEDQKNDMQESLLAHSQDVKIDVQEEQIIVDEALNNNNNRSSSSTIQTGEKQPDRFRDAWAGALFIAHQLVILYLAIAWGRSSVNYTYGMYSSTDTVSFSGAFYLCLTSSVVSLLVAGSTLAIVIRWADQLVQISLCLSLVWNVLLVLYFATHLYWYGAGASLFFLLWNAWYARSVWRRIPFAAANLRAAVTAVQTNAGIMAVALGLAVSVLLWSMLWLLAYLGVYMRHATCSSGECYSHVNGGVVLLFILSFYWTSQVMKNILHVVVAGVVGTWFFAPQDASTFFSPAVQDSMVRATTYSFGSICLGSLLTALLQVSNYVIREARRHNRCSPMLMCVLECMVDFLERMVAYFNQYAYVYIGLYGYDYLTAGRSVMTLFGERGWSLIINDHLVLRVLGLLSFVIGALTGCLGLVIASFKPSWVDEFGSGSTAVAFFVPFLIGASLAYILMSIIASAVDTILVGFAEDPLQFERNHPGLYTQMVVGWRAVYPEEFGM